MKIHNETSLSTAALIAGFSLLAMVLTAPVAEFYVFPKLIVSGNAKETFNNIINNRMLFVLGIFLYLITFIADVVVAWALYVFLRPVNSSLSLLTAWFRLVYTAISLVALLNLIKVLSYIRASDYLAVFEKDELYAHALFSIKTFRVEWQFGFVFFSIHLLLLGYLVFRSGYVPKMLGILLIVAGFGYLIDNLRPFLFPEFNTGFLMITFFGELIFMLWLLVRGGKAQSPAHTVLP